MVSCFDDDDDTKESKNAQNIKNTNSDNTLNAQSNSVDISISGKPQTKILTNRAYYFKPNFISKTKTVTFNIKNKPKWLDFNLFSGALEGTPKDEDKKTYHNIQISIKDRYGNKASLKNFSIDVSNSNAPPRIFGNPPLDVFVDTEYIFEPIAEDDEQVDGFTFTIKNKPAWAIFNALTGSLTGKPTIRDIGITKKIQIGVLDLKDQESLLPQFKITIKPTPSQPPVFKKLPPKKAYITKQYRALLMAYQPGDRQQKLTYEINGLPHWLEYSQSANTIIGIPQEGDEGLFDSIIVTATNENGVFEELIFDIEVVEKKYYKPSPQNKKTPKSKNLNTNTTVGNIKNTNTGIDVTKMSKTNSTNKQKKNIIIEKNTINNNDIHYGISSEDIVQADTSTSQSDYVWETNKDHLLIFGNPTAKITQGDFYSFTPYVSGKPSSRDVIFAIYNQPIWASFSTSSGTLYGYPQMYDVGIYDNIIITLNYVNSNNIHYLPSFSIEIVDIEDEVNEVDILKVINITSSNKSFVALTALKTLYAWGDIDNITRAYVSTIKNVSKVVATDKAFGALHIDGNISVFGDNLYGGSYEHSSTYIGAIQTNFANITSNRHAFVAIRANNTVYAWGDINKGGNNNDVNMLSDVDKIYSNDQAFVALKTDKTMFAWGDSLSGGDNSAINTLTNVFTIASSSNAFSALLEDGKVYSWGDVLNGASTALLITSDVDKIYSNNNAFVALKTDGSVYAWGDNLNGGDNSAVNTLVNVSKIYSNNNAFVALKTDGSVYAWGDNLNGGDNSAVNTLVNVSKIYSNNNAFVALKTDGSVYAWGDNLNGGDNSAVNTLVNVSKIYSNNNAFVALKTDGSVYAWGDNASGGDNSAIDTLVNVSKIYSNNNAFVTIHTNKTISVWGDDASGGNETLLQYYKINP